MYWVGACFGLGFAPGVLCFGADGEGGGKASWAELGPLLSLLPWLWGSKETLLGVGVVGAELSALWWLLCRYQWPADSPPCSVARDMSPVEAVCML